MIAVVLFGIVSASQCLSGPGKDCWEPSGYCDNFVCAVGNWSHCQKYSNVCACGTMYNDGSKDSGKKACCGWGCPQERPTEVVEVVEVAAQQCLSGPGKDCWEPSGYCDNFVCSIGNWSHCQKYSNVCACGTMYNDGSKDSGKKACCGWGCPQERPTEVVEVVEVATPQCLSGPGKDCWESSGYCDNYLCDLGNWSHCQKYSNICACGTTYVDGSEDNDKKACCGNDCPRKRGDVDNHGCKRSLDEFWCEEMQQCIRPWETECKKADVETHPHKKGGDADKYGCKHSTGYQWCAELSKCVRSWETPCKAGELTLMV